MSKRQLPDSAWHIGYVKKEEDEPRRHKSRCIFNDGKNCMSPHMIYCNGSAHCKYYAESEDDARYFGITVIKVHKDTDKVKSQAAVLHKREKDMENAFLWTGRGNWIEGRQKKKKFKGSKKNSQLKTVCDLCRKIIPKVSYYKHREEVHGIKYVTLKELKTVNLETAKVVKVQKKAVKKQKVERVCVTCSNYNITEDICSITNKNEQRNHCLFYKLGETK